MWFKLYTKFSLIIPTLLGVPVHTGVDIGGSSGTRWEPELFHRYRNQARPLADTQRYCFCFFFPNREEEFALPVLLACFLSPVFYSISPVISDSF